MSKKYFVRNTQADVHNENKWIEMNGVQFYEFVTSSDADGRYFIKMPSLSEDGSDDFIIIEADKDEYIKWRKETRRKRHLREYGTEHKDYTIVSYHAIISDSECYGEELLTDDRINVESKVEQIMTCEKLTNALMTLSAEERWLMDELYLSDIQKSVHQLSKEFGIPRMTINDRKNRVLEKLKKFL